MDITAAPASADPASVVRPRKRRRPAVVCAECRRRKIACDRKTPCGQCALHNVECVYVTGAVPPPYGRPVRSPGGGGGGSARNPKRAKTADGGERSGGSSRSDNDVEEEDDPSSTFAMMGERPSRFGGRLAKTRLFGRTHWMNNMDQFKEIRSLTHLVHAVIGSSMYQNRVVCKRLAQLIKADEARRVAETPAGGFRWLPVLGRPVMDRLVALYFGAFESAFRVLHRPTFERAYAGYCQGDAPAAETFMVQLVLVLALGSCFYEGPDAVALRDELRLAARRAVARAGVVACTPVEKRQLALETLQTYCLVLLARQTTALETGDDLSFFSTGGLLHAAFGMGLNRDPSHFQSMTPFQAETRRRLWATVLELVLQAALDQGMPPLVGLDDFDCGAPANLDDGALREDENGKDRCEKHPDSVFTQTSLQRLLCRSQPTRLKILKALNGLGPGLSYERALQLSSDLLEACRYAAAALRGPPNDFAPLRIFLYELLTRRFHHALHSPFARKAHAHVQFFFSRRARIESALRLHSLLRGGADVDADEAADDQLLSDPCWRLAVLGRGLVKCALVDMNATVAYEMIVQLQEDFVPGADLTLSQRELYDAVRSIVRLSRLRVRDGETNVKSYLFFSSGLAQIEALRSGCYVRQRIMDAAQAGGERMVAALRALALRRGIVLPDVEGEGGAGGGDGGGGDRNDRNDDNDRNDNLDLPLDLPLVDPLLLGPCEDPGSADADLDSGIHMSTISSASGLWSDEWIVDPHGDFGYGNWFFPYNERVGLE